MKISSGQLRDLVRIERPVADDALDGAGSGNWVLVDRVWAHVQDRLMSRGEDSAAGFTTSSRVARVRMRYRRDITPDMRIVMGDRVMQIISGPAEIGRREGIELMVEEHIVGGSGA